MLEVIVKVVVGWLVVVGELDEDLGMRCVDVMRMRMGKRNW